LDDHLAIPSEEKPKRQFDNAPEETGAFPDGEKVSEASECINDPMGSRQSGRESPVKDGFYCNVVKDVGFFVS
jgi:hypothetical protein